MKQQSVNKRGWPFVDETIKIFDVQIKNLSGWVSCEAI
jgi:hypothetical protein